MFIKDLSTAAHEGNINHNVGHVLHPLAYSPKDFSLVSGLSISSLTRDRKNGCLGGIPYVNLGGRVVYPVAAVQDWFNQNLKHGRHDLLPEVVGLQKRGRGRPAGTTKAFLKNQKTTLKQGSQL